MRTLLLSLGLLLLAATQAVAVDLVNKDNKSYKVRVTADNGSITTLIGPMASMGNVCPGSCRIEVESVGSIPASYGQSIAIEAGKLVVE
jgi:hypothetical protein